MKVDFMRKVDYYAGIPLAFLCTPLVKFMDLFRGPDDILKAQIVRIDINRTTPMDALAILQSLQDRARSLSH